jgi:hypothetical protein
LPDPLRRRIVQRKPKAGCGDIREEVTMRWLLKGAAGAAVLVAALYLFGLSRPDTHVARTRAHYATAPEVLWAALSEVERWPEWNPEVRSVERLPDRNGHPVMNVVGSWGAAATKLTVVEPPARLRTEMDAGDFSGSWSYELERAMDGGTVLTVTEEGRVGNPFFRAMMLFHDNYATMTDFHRALGSRLGEVVEPERVELLAPPDTHGPR